MRSFVRSALLALVPLVFLPSALFAQASITGVVKDTSGAVLPGVTVEASSPALIERVRSVVTDGTGQYRIENLRPGTYAVTFTLPGFNVVKRDGIELTGNFTASINAELRVGSLEETITVTSESPIVDVQSTNRQQVLNTELIDAVPVNRAPGLMGALVPGLTSGVVDVGGTSGNPFTGGSLTTHGSRATDYMLMLNGIDTKNLETGGGGQMAMNMAMYQETVVQSSTLGAELGTGGAQVNLIPREGGNTFKGSVITAFASKSMQGDNFSQELKDRGLPTPDRLKEMLDFNPAFGGPIKTDRLWFFGSARYLVEDNYVANFYNLNAYNPNAWTYAPDTSRQAFTHQRWPHGGFRFTWQAAAKQKLSFGSERQCGCPFATAVSASVSPESALVQWYRPSGAWDINWTSPMTNRLLFEGMLYRRYQYSRRAHPEGPLADPPDDEDIIRQMNATRLAERWIGVTDQALGLTYRGVATANSRNLSSNWSSRAAVSYVTGAHALKVGFSNASGHRRALDLSYDAPIAYRFNNGVPNQLTMFASPTTDYANQNWDLGVYVQDRWTIRRLTLNYGLRYDHYKTSFPGYHVGPTLLAPTRDITFTPSDGVNWHDLTPRMGAAYDLFGTGKTALKVSAARYIASQTLVGNGVNLTFGDQLNPSQRLVRTTTRSWNDNTFPAGDPRRGNYVADCDLINPAANGECGAMANTDFGSTRPGATYDPKTISGWGHRNYNWQFSAGVQHEIAPRISADIGYFRRVYGNIVVTDNRALSAADFDQFSISAPSDARLPDGGGQTVTGLFDIKPAKFGIPTDNYVTFSDNFGKQIEHWNGVDLSVNARPRPGLMLMGGMSTGRTSFNNCEVAAKVPEMLFGLPAFGTSNNNVWTPLQYCKQDTKFLTQLKGVGTYTIPRIDVQISGTFQSLPGPQILANYTATNAVIAPSLGRNLSGGSANAVVSVVSPGTLYGDRRNQVDMRFGKILTFGRTKSTVSVDLYNALNANPVLSENAAFATWRRPLSILPARFAKFTFQVDF